MKKLLTKSGLLMVLLCLAMTVLAACTGGTEPTSGTTGTPTTTVIPKLSTPVVSLSEDGVASWPSVGNASGYSYVIDNGSPQVTTKTTVQLQNGQSISVMAVSGSVAFLDSEYSTPVTYQAPSGVLNATIAEVLSGELDTSYRVTGYVCATASTSFLLADNGSYLYVYAEREHGLAVGDEAEVVGTAVSYANIIELKSVQSIERIRQGTVDHPTKTEADKEFFESQLQAFTQGAYVSFTAPVTVSGNYLNVAIDGLEGAMVSLIANSEAFESGKEYTVTGYLTYITGSNTKYINVLLTDVRPADQPTGENCPHCGGTLSEGDHSLMNCGHYACGPYDFHRDCPYCDGFLCWEGHEENLDCGHFSCQEGEHSRCEKCNGFLCYEGHEELSCGHRRCESGYHEPCSACGGYQCEGDHGYWPCGRHFICRGGDHGILACGHFACDEGDHVTTCPHCGRNLCQGGNHDAFDCGNHHICVEGENHYNHRLLACGHYACAEGNHEQYGCGHSACQGGEHYICASCGGYICQGDHEICKENQRPCPQCGNPRGEGNHNRLACGHYACMGGNHNMTDCGHYVCQGGEHAKYPCGHYNCQEDALNHSALSCGHYACQEGHYIQDCGVHYSCVEGEHYRMPCGHFACEEGNHGYCSACGQLLCQTDPSLHVERPCGDHRYCEANDLNHEQCECGGYICDGGHTELECGHRICQDGFHALCRFCMQYACNGGNHDFCAACGEALCQGNHELYPCGNHRTCEFENAEGGECPICSDPCFNGHNYIESIIPPSCNSTGYTKYTCSVCGDTQIANQVGPNGVHSWNANGSCNNCGTTLQPNVKPTYQWIDGYLYFGEYPQTVKADNVVITNITNDKGYYLGTDGEWYLRHVAETYRDSTSNEFNNGASIIPGNVYYFKVEPIKWMVLESSGNTYSLVCASVIATGAFNSRIDTTDYLSSEVREWLVGEFSQTAFTAGQQSMLNPVAVGTDNAANYVYDTVYLLTKPQANAMAQEDRVMISSDYARATGLSNHMDMSGSFVHGSAMWWLRTPDGGSTSTVSQQGVLGRWMVYETFYGYVPGITITVPAN